MPRWDKPGIPHKDWSHLFVEDLGEAEFICEMCGQEEIRYVHHLTHTAFSLLRVGCVCAVHLCEDETTPRKREGQARNKARTERARKQREEAKRVQEETQRAQAQQRLLEEEARRAQSQRVSLQEATRRIQEAARRVVVQRQAPPVDSIWTSFAKPQARHNGPSVWVNAKIQVEVGRHLEVVSQSDTKSRVEIVAISHQTRNYTLCFCRWVNRHEVSRPHLRLVPAPAKQRNPVVLKPSTLSQEVLDELFS